MKETRSIAKEAADIREKPITGALINAGYLLLNEWLTKKTLVQDKELLKDCGLRTSSPRSMIIDALIENRLAVF